MSESVQVNAYGDGELPCLQKIELVGYYADGSTTVMTVTGANIEVDIERPEPDFIDQIKVRPMTNLKDYKITFDRVNWVGWVNHDPESTKIAKPVSHGYKFEGQE